MVGIMATATPRERLGGLINSIKIAPDIPSKLDHLRCLSDDLLQDDPVLLAEFLPLLLDLTSDRSSPVRKFIIQMVGEIGMKQPEFLPEIVPVLVSVLNDESPPVARQAISCGLNLFRCTFRKIAIQGLFSTELDDSLESSWGWMLNFKDKIYAKAFQPIHKPGRNGIKLLALKFVEAIILLYTPDPNGSSEPPPHQSFGGNLNGFNTTWLRSGHPVLNVGDLSVEASQRLGLLLDQLRFPTVKSLSSLTIIVLINSLSAVAKKRSAFYGRILPVLLDLDPASYVTNGPHVCGASHALKNAFHSCLESTHPGAAPWRDRILLALKEIQDGRLAKKLEDHDYKTNGNEEGENDSPEEKVTAQTVDIGTKVRKRMEAEDSIDRTSENDVSGKRARSSPSISEESSNELRKKGTIFQDENSSTRPSPPKADGDSISGPVQQLVALFGALVAQGEKAAAPLEILISSISADLLAEVVMANMRHLPMERPKADEEGGQEEVFSLSSAFPQIASILDVQQPMFDIDLKAQEEEEDEHVVAADDSSIVESEKIHEDESSVWPSALPVTDATEIEEGLTDASAGLHEMGNLEIPGLTSITNTNEQSETSPVASLSSTDVEETSQEQDTILVEKPALDILPSISNDRSAELSPKPMSVDENIQITSTATSIGLPSHFVLPKMSAPVVDLADEQKDHLQQLAFSRIIDAYKDAEAAGSSQARFALLSHIGMEFPSELDPWKLLQQHIVSDYMNHEGHELTLRLLYRLFGEAEVESDFFSSTTATSAYEMLLLNVAETLKDSFPASDKSLSRLLGEVPHLPLSVLTLLESLCSPCNVGTPEESQNGDRVTQGLSSVWSLILLRPPVRDACLKIALQSTIHHLEEVRMKAIRLVANKLYPLPSISQQIEEFASNMLLSVTVDGADKMEIDKSVTDPVKDSSVEKVLGEHPTVDLTSKETSSDPRLSSSEENPSNSLAEAQRSMSLYFALCTKKHSLFRHIFTIYESASKAAKEAIHRHIPMLVRTMGASSELLEIISDAPGGSVNFITQVLRTLTEGAIPSPELIRAIRKLYDSKLKDVEILMPILPFLQKDEVSSVFPQLLNLPSDKFQAALLRILKGSSHAGATLSPEEVLIAIHGIDPERDRMPLKKVTDACNACFEQKDIFTQQVLAKVLNQLVEQTPLPLLFMRTVLQSIGAFPGLVEFIMDNILARLVKKQIWKYPKLWVGFLKCLILTKPQSFDVLLQLPAAQLESALNRTAAPLKEPLIAHASQPNIRSSLPRATLVVLGIISYSQAPSQAQSSQTPAQSSQTQASQSQTTGSSEKEPVPEKEVSSTGG